MGADCSLNRGLPASPQAERSILGAILLDGGYGPDGKLIDGLDALRPDDMSLDAHRRLLSRMWEMIEQRIPVDIVALTETLICRNELDAFGGAGYLASLTDGVPRRSSVRHYVSILKDKRALRQLIISCTAGIERATAQSVSAEEIITATQRQVAEVQTETSAARNLFVPASDFLARMQPTKDWLVENLIQRGSNGFVVAEPKGSKSFATMALADALARGTEWLGFNIPKRARVGVLNAEDNPETSRWRLDGLEKHHGGFREELDGWLWLATRDQFNSFKFDRPTDVRDLIASVRELGIEFLILDVLNVLHNADENDNTQMVRILDNIKSVQAKAGCQIGIVHHYNKSDGRSVTQRMRGSSAISGFAEWIVGIELTDENTKIRRARFEIKSGEAPLPVCYRIANQPSGGVKFEVIDDVPEPRKGLSARSAIAGMQ
jgi:hypothetical protein